MDRRWKSYGSIYMQDKEQYSLTPRRGDEADLARRDAADEQAAAAEGPHGQEADAAQRDWNRDLQEALELADSAAKHRRIFELAHDFVAVASTYARCIVSELGLPDADKSIRPLPSPGRRTFLVQGILFKLATDFPLAPSAPGARSTYMFGGARPADELAMKACGNELNGLMNYYQVSQASPADAGRGLHFPLLAAIDYLGFRLLASSVLPLGRDTQRYGAAAGGEVRASDPQLNQLLARAALHLNLREHVAGRPPHVARVWSCGDLEGHLGRDGRYYLCEFARAFPPQAPANAAPDEADADDQQLRLVYCRQLRPELVRSCATPLNPDAFTRWDNADHEAERWRREVCQATQVLLRERVPQLATALDQHVAGPLRDVARAGQLDKLRVAEHAHRLGVNCRQLARVRTEAREPRLRELLLVECVARAAKTLLRAQLRAAVRHARGSAAPPVKAALVAHLNLLQGRGRVPALDAFRAQLAAQLAAQFEAWQASDLVQLQMDPGLQLLVLLRVLQLADVALAPEAAAELASAADAPAPALFELVPADVDECRVRVRHMNIVALHEAMALALDAHAKRERERLRLLTLAVHKFEASIALMPQHPLALLEAARALHALALLKPPADALRLLDKALERCQAAEALHADLPALSLAHVMALLDRVRLSDEPASRTGLLDRLQLVTGRAARAGYASPLQQLAAQLLTDAGTAPPAPARSRALAALLALCTALVDAAPASSATLHLLSAAQLLHARLVLRQGPAFHAAVEEAMARLTHALELAPTDAPAVRRELLDQAHQHWLAARSGRAPAARRCLVIRLTALALETLATPTELAQQLEQLLVYAQQALPAQTMQQALAEAALTLQRLLEADGALARALLALRLATPVGPAARVLDRLLEQLGYADLQGCLASPAQLHLLAQAGGRLTRVNLADCPLVDDGALVALGASRAALEALDLSQCRGVTERGLAALLAGPACARLEALALRATAAGPGALVPLLAAAPAAAVLRLLDVGACALGSVAPLSRLAQLERLHMDSATWADPSLMPLLLHLSRLQVLSLRDTRISSGAVVDLSLRCSALQELCLAKCPQLTDTAVAALAALPLLRVLNLSENFSLESGVSRLTRCRSLQQLILKDCKRLMQQAACDLLASSSLELLDLDGFNKKINGFVSSTATKFSFSKLMLGRCKLMESDSLGKLLARSVHLTALDLSSAEPAVTDDIVTVLRCLPLSYLNLNECKRLTPEVLDVCLAITSLQSLSLAKCRLGPSFTANLSRALTLIHTLDISYCGLASPMIDPLSNLPQIRELNLAGNSVSDVNMQSLATNSALQQLNLTLTNISDKALNRFAKRKEPTIHTMMLGRCQLLTNKSVINLLRFQPIEILELWEVSRLTDDILEFIISHQLLLRQIGLERCEHISEEAAERLTLQKPHIRITVNKSSQVINELQRNLELRSKAREEIVSPEQSPKAKVPPQLSPSVTKLGLKPPSLETVKLRKVEPGPSKKM